MGMSENTFYRLSGVCGILAIVFALPSMYIFGPGISDFVCIATGILAIVALFIENKICLLCAMIGGIIAAICLAFLMVVTVFASALCAAADSLVGAVCESQHDQRVLGASCDRTVEGHNCAVDDAVTCCFGCTTTGKCTGSGCEWTASYINVDCTCDCEEKNQQACNANDQSGCVCKKANGMSLYGADEAECDAAQTAGSPDFGGGGWTCTSSLVKAGCAQGIDGYTEDDANSGCTKAAGTYTGDAADGLVDCKALAMQTTGGQTWKNTGCPSDGIVATADTGEEEADGNHYCEYAALANVLVFLHLAVVIAVSIGGCCVVCCGKGPDDGGDDDKSDE